MARTVACSLQNLPSHSIFVPPTTPGDGNDDEWELVERPSRLAGPKVSRMVMRDRDLILAVGSEIRMSSVASGEAWEVQDTKVGSYKILKTLHKPFQIQQLILSASGRLLAVVGQRQISVIVLPKSGQINTTTGEVTSRSFAIDEFLYSASSKAEISKVSWHPWGAGGNSLWILTTDGKLREYDILHPDDPAQEFNFLPEHAASSSRFTAIDPLSHYATSFAFSTSQHDFSRLMVYVLMGNGDVYAMGPIMPLHTEMPLPYLQSLNAYTDLRSRRLSGVRGLDDPEAAAKLGRAALQAQWVESLVKQVRQEDDRRARQDESSTPGRRGSLLSHRRSGSTSSLDTRPPLAESTVRVHPPYLTEKGGPAPGVHRPMMRQGPIVFTPGPRDEEEVDEQIASDIIIFDAEAAEDEKVTSGGGILVGLVWSNARVDLGVLVEQAEPRWISARDASPSVPSIPIVESIQLFSSPEDVNLSMSSSPYFTLDPVNPDTLFVQHCGVASICVAPLVEALQSDHLTACEWGQLVEAIPTNPIIGVAVSSNIALGYIFLALSASHQLVAVELDYRIAAPSTDGAERDSDNQPRSVSDKETRSLLLTSPFDYAKTFRNLSELTIPRVVGIGRTPLQTVSVEHLKTFGTIHSHLQSCVRRLLEMSGSIEQRLDLEVQEYQRQLRVLQDCQARVARLDGRARVARVEALLAEQAALGDRLDRVLLALAGEYRPPLGEAEKKWFEELERLKARTRGGALSRGKGLSGKVQLLKDQLASLRPDVKKGQQQANMKTNTSTPSRLVKVDEGTLASLKNDVVAKSEELRKLVRKLEDLELQVEEVELDVEDD